MSATSHNNPIDAWNRGGGAGFGAVKPQDEELHGKFPEVGDSLTETWAYMFYEPEARVSVFVYLWVHPNLELMTGGIMAWQGIKEHHLQAELFDVRAYTAVATQIANNGRQWRLANGLTVDIVEPFKTIQIKFDDPARGNRVDVTLTAAAAPVMREHNKHFDQMLAAKGEVWLRGTKHRIDGYGCRDRSWAEPRPEEPYPLPPFSWMTARFPSGLSWNANAQDDPARQPEWLATYPGNPADSVKDAWVARDGEQLRLKSLSKLTKRNPHTGCPVSHDIDMIDNQGRTYRIHGEIIAAVPWSGWPNMVCWICCTRWDCNGEVGYGDTQEVQWTDFIFKHRAAYTG